MATIPLPPDFLGFLRLLNSRRVEYLLIGGYAVGLHGYPRATADLDVWVAMDPRNAAQITEAIHEFGFAIPDLAPQVFLEQASLFFEEGSLGFSPSAREGEYDALELRAHGWQVEPLHVDHVVSSFFEDQDLFPTGSIEFDCALLMEGIAHQWHSRESLYCDVAR